MNYYALTPKYPIIPNIFISYPFCFPKDTLRLLTLYIVQAHIVSKMSVMDGLQNCKITFQSFREMEGGDSGEVTAFYKNDVVVVHYSSKRDVNLTKKDLVELAKVRK